MKTKSRSFTITEALPTTNRQRKGVFQAPWYWGAGCFLGRGQGCGMVTLSMFQVYSIISVQLLITVAIIAIFTFV